MGYAGAVQFIGFSLVPGINSLFTIIDTSLLGLDLNVITVPGLFLAFANVFIMLLCWLFFSRRVAIKSPTHTVEIPKRHQQAFKPIQAESRHSRKLTIVGAIVFILLNFVARGILSLIETLGTPIFLRVWNDQDGDALSDASQFYLYLGLAGLAIYLTVGWTQRWISEAYLLLLGFCIIGSGLVVLGIDTPGLSMVRFTAGASLLLSLGSPIVQTVILSSFSTILGSHPQGTLMGIITCAGSLGRILFPLFGSLTSEQGTFLLGAGLSFISALFVIGYFLWVKWEKRQEAEKCRFKIGFDDEDDDLLRELRM
jgi:hypothetical protein